MLSLEQIKAPLHGYVLIDYSKPLNKYKPISHHELTELEASNKNQGYAMNGLSLRLVREDRYWAVESTDD